MTNDKSSQLINIAQITDQYLAKQYLSTKVGRIIETANSKVYSSQCLEGLICRVYVYMFTCIILM